MGKLSIPRLALAIAISGILLFPPTESFAAKTWLEERLDRLFSAQQQSSKQRKPRRAKNTGAPSAVRKFGSGIRLPDTAPLPEFAARDLAEADAPLEDKPLPDVSEEKLPLEAQKSSDLPSDNVATEPPKHMHTAETSADKKSSDDIELPESAPAPDEAPSKLPADNPAADLPETSVPLPEDKPAGTETAPLDAIPTEPPKPEFRPDKPDPEKPEPKAAEPPPPPDPRSVMRPDPSGQLPAEEIACRQRLAELGVKFDNRPAQSDPAGCSMPYPITVTSLGKDIDLQPDAEMNCPMAEAAARFARDVMAPAANEIFGERLTSISHASAYVCRSRNGTQKLSEHAFGNALDIASFTLSGGTTVAVEPAPPEKNALFIARVRGAACGPFKTVLGPGAPDHSEHLHFDLAPRRNGGTVCE